MELFITRLRWNRDQLKKIPVKSLNDPINSFHHVDINKMLARVATAATLSTGHPCHHHHHHHHRLHLLSLPSPWSSSAAALPLPTWEATFPHSTIVICVYILQVLSSLSSYYVQMPRHIARLRHVDCYELIWLFVGPLWDISWWRLDVNAQYTFI